MDSDRSGALSADEFAAAVKKLVRPAQPRSMDLRAWESEGRRETDKQIDRQTDRESKAVAACRRHSNPLRVRYDSESVTSPV